MNDIEILTERLKIIEAVLSETLNRVGTLFPLLNINELFNAWDEAELNLKAKAGNKNVHSI